MRQSISFFFIFVPFYTKFLLWVLLLKKAKDEVLLLPIFRFCNTNAIITYIQTAGACACVFPLSWWIRRTTKGQSWDLWESRFGISNKHFEVISKDHSSNYFVQWCRERTHTPPALPPRHPTFLKYILLCLIFLNGLSYF